MDCELRLAHPGDGPEMAEIYGPFVRETAISFETEAPDGEEFARRITRTLTERPWLSAQGGGRLLGYCYAGPHRARAAYRWATEVSIYLAPDARGRGLGRRLYRALFALLARQGYCRSWAVITLPNPGSEAFHRALGFEQAGLYRDAGWKQGAWHDVAWYGLALAAPPADPRPPRALSEMDEREIAAVLRAAG
jgi:L-amino acid N-acyltransferase YncA